MLYPTETIIRGMSQIIHSPSNLISDYVEIAGAGAALTNSGLLTLLSLFILRKYSHSFCPLTIPIVMMLSGFSFFGKNLANSAPILLGSLLYLHHKPAARQESLVMGLLSTCLSPMVSLIYLAPSQFLLQNKFIALVAGLVIGYISIPVFHYLKAHTKEMNLYNMGFSAGCIGFIGNFATRNLLNIRILPHRLNAAHSSALLIFLLILFTAPLMYALYVLKFDKALHKGVRLSLLKLVRFSIYGLIGLMVPLILQVPLNGLLVGTLLTFAGFSMYNFGFRYYFFPACGVLLSSLFIFHDVTSTTTIVILFFAATLSPFSRKYGLLTGILSGAIFAMISRHAHVLTAGINLYNCGFSGGVTVLLLDFLRHLLFRHALLKRTCSAAYQKLILSEQKILWQLSRCKDWIKQRLFPLNYE
ncbi:DUF1576 domain-containing protein [Candidatus Enterococcus ferrettii]|nr:DUF1576 domain-containing protein [Enterococcus sp. 665A]